MKVPRVCILATKPDGALIEMDSRFLGNRSRNCLEYKGFSAIPDFRFQHRIPLADGETGASASIILSPFGLRHGWTPEPCGVPDRHPDRHRPRA